MLSSTLQINWKQRFFVPTEEEPGIAILAAILKQFPVIATDDDESDWEVPSDLATPSASTVQPIDLETWIIETAEPHRINDEERLPKAMPESEGDSTSYASELRCMHPIRSVGLPTAHQVSPAAMLQKQSMDYRTPTIQIGFNFVENEY